MSKEPENTLFVDADGDADQVESETDVNMDISAEESDSASDSEDTEDDPIIDSVPIYLNNTSAQQNIHLLQYMSKPRKHPAPLVHLGASLKPESNFLRVKLPLDTSKFYDEAKKEEWGVKVTDHDHSGVMNKTNGGIYAASFINNENGRKVVMVPVQSTTQLRPSFKYLDDLENQKLQQRREPIEQKPNQNVHILQSSAKAAKPVSNDPLANSSLGESLRHVRRFEQEPWHNLEFDAHAQDIKNNILTTNDKVLESTDTMAQYIDKLTK